MEFPALRGRSILVVEDELLIGMDIRSALEEAGAHVTSTTTVRHALILAEHDGLAGAIMDHALADGDSTSPAHRWRYLSSLRWGSPWQPFDAGRALRTRDRLLAGRG